MVEQAMQPCYGFNGAIGLSLSFVVLQDPSQDWELAEGLTRFEHARGGPAQGHLGMAPALDVALDDADGPQRILNDVGAGERAPEFLGQAGAG